MLVCLVYVSTLYIDPDGDDLRTICEAAQTKNASLDITGALYTEGSLVLQILEGPVNNVVPLAQVISADPRHQDFTLLNCWTITERRFGAWRMKAVGNQKLTSIKGSLSHQTAADTFHSPNPTCLEELVTMQALPGYG